MHRRVWPFALLALFLAACGGPTGVTPPEPPSGGVEVASDFEVTLTGLKPIADTYVSGNATYLEQGGVHFVTGSAVRNAGFENESRVRVHLRLRGALEERTYTASRAADQGDDLQAGITVDENGFTGYDAVMLGGNLGITEITERYVEGSFLFVFEDRSGKQVETVANFRATMTTPPTE